MKPTCKTYNDDAVVFKSQKTQKRRKVMVAENFREIQLKTKKGSSLKKL